MPEDTQQSGPQTVAPESGRLVDDKVLWSNGLTAFGSMRGYSGTADPMAVWNALVGETRESIRYLRELELKDDTVGDAMEEMKRSVLKRNITILPLDESNSVASEIADFLQAQFDALPNWRNTLEAIMDAPFYGFSVAEQVFDVSAGQVALLDIRDCPQELFSFGAPLMPQTGQLRLYMGAGDYQGTLVPENKFVVWSSRMRAGNRRGRSLLREVYWPSWINRNVLRFWLRLAERGPGTAVVSYADGASDSEKQQALSAAEALITQVAMAIPEGMEIRDEFLKVARTQDPATYLQLSDKMESKIIRRIVGSTLTSKGSDGGKGTQALGKVHADTKEERSVEYAMQLEGILNRQVVPQLVWWNYGPDAPMVRVRLDKSDEEDLGERVTVDDSLQQMGLSISESYARSKYGIPAPKEGDAILVRSAAPPPEAIQTPAGSPDKPQFADALNPNADPTITQQVTREQKDFDKLFLQMRKAGREQYAKQISDLASTAMNATTGR